MPCDPDVLKNVPLFALLDEDELAVLASQVELRNFARRQRIYKLGDPGRQAYVVISGSVQVSTVDDDHQEVLVDAPGPGEFFGFASMIDESSHQTTATATDDTVCVEVDRNDITVLLQRKPWPEWICSPPWAGSSMPPRIWSGFGLPATPTRSSKMKPLWEIGYPILLPALEAPGSSSSLFSSFSWSTLPPIWL